METCKTVKGVDDETWSRFKSMAARKNVTLGDCFREMVDDFESGAGKGWDLILNGPRILSRREGNEMKAVVRRMRKEYGFRI